MNANIFIENITEIVFGLIPILFVLYIIWQMFVKDFFEDVLNFFRKRK
jgi:hypothetical protein